MYVSTFLTGFCWISSQGYLVHDLPLLLDILEVRHAWIEKVTVFWMLPDSHALRGLISSKSSATLKYWLTPIVRMKSKEF